MINSVYNIQNNYYSPLLQRNKTNLKASESRNNGYIKPVHIIPAYHRAQVLPFKAAQAPSEATMKYIELIRELDGSLENLNQLASSEIKDIAAGIDIFEGWDSYDIKFVTDYMDAIFLQRGCPHHCSHCAADSEHKITTMSWKNFETIANGMGELKERLGFNPFRLNDTENRIYPFIDSDPMLFKSPTGLTDENGNPVYRDIHDAAKLFYEKTGTKFLITTAGWSPKNKFVQKAAEKIVNDSECISVITISVHPFHRYFEKARKLEREADREKNEDNKKRLNEKAEKERNKYYEMMVNTIYTFLPLAKSGKVGILSMDLPEDAKDKYPEWESVERIKSQIYDKLKKKVIEEKGEEYLLEEIKNIDIKNREISYEGRAYDFAPPGASGYGTRKYSERHYATLYDDKYHQKVYELYRRDPKYFIYNKNPKRIDLDGSILLNYTNFSFNGDIKFYPVRLVGKKLNLPEPQEIKTQRTVPEYPWPDERFLNK